MASVPRPIKYKIKDIINSKTNIKKITLAIPAAAVEIPVKPKMADRTDIAKNISVHVSISLTPVTYGNLPMSTKIRTIMKMSPKIPPG